MKNIAANTMLFHRRAGHVRINLLKYNTELKNVLRTFQAQIAIKHKNVQPQPQN